MKTWLAAGLIALVGACGQQPVPSHASGFDIVADAGAERAEVVRIYTDEAFYRRRGEPEQPFVGRLERKDVVQGPGTRRHAYRLVTDDREIPVYATPAADGRLQPLVGRQAQVEGKLIDLRDEGFGLELWIGTIAPQSP